MGLLVVALVVALLLTALLQPLDGGLRRLGSPPALAAAAATLTLLAVLAALGLVVSSRSVAQLSQLPPVLGFAVDELRRWLVEGPVDLDASQVDELRSAVTGYLTDVTPTAANGAMTAARLLGALAVFAVLLLLEDRREIWQWLLHRLPHARRPRTEAAGEAAWDRLTRSVQGTVLVASPRDRGRAPGRCGPRREEALEPGTRSRQPAEDAPPGLLRRPPQRL